MTDHDELMSTLEVPRRAHEATMRSWPMLTILAHPDPARVGACAWLGVGRTELSRLAPLFEPPTGGPARGLDDRSISRQPVLLSVTKDGAVRLDPGQGRIEVISAGRLLDRAERIDASLLERGVVLEIADRVALLVHTVPRARTALPDTLGLIGRSDAMETVRRQVLQVADLSIPVLVRGESGVGKELVARAVHRASKRGCAPYEAVNMAAVPPTLAASELFGHERGAFSGADRARRGYFERADGGTLFLDEIGDTPVDVQALLLRALESGEIQRVGADRTKTVSVRVVAATDADLEAASARGDFRGPLLHRLAGFQIQVPPLRRRREDIGRLFFHFVREALDSMGGADRLGAPTTDTRRPWIPTALVTTLCHYDWPGNVRQLRNVARQLVITNRDVDEMAWQAQIADLLPPRSGATTTQAPAPKPATPTRSYRKPADVGEDELVSALRAHGWRLAPTAKALEISRTTLYTLVERSSRIRKASDLSGAEILASLESEGAVAPAARKLEVSTHALKLRMKALHLTR